MGPFILAWLVGEGIIVFRTMRDGKKATGHYVPPGPGQLVWSSGLFVMLAVLAQSQNARPLATTLAVGFDIAAFLNLYNVGAAPLKVKWPPSLLPDTVIYPGTTAPGSGLAKVPGDLAELGGSGQGTGNFA